MHNFFYASGFLYHSPTQKILLQRINLNDSETFTLFCGKGHGGENAALVFQRKVHEIIEREISLTSIRPVYDYISKELQKNHFIFYADVSDISNESHFENDGKAVWFTARQLTKLKLPKHILHDIVIGQRVLQAAFVEKMGNDALSKLENADL